MKKNWKSWLVPVGTMAWIFLKLALVTAMLNQNVSEFVYAGF